MHKKAVKSLFIYTIFIKMAQKHKEYTVKSDKFGHTVGDKIPLHPTTAKALAKHGIVEVAKEKGEDK